MPDDLRSPGVIQGFLIICFGLIVICVSGACKSVISCIFSTKV